MSGAYIQQLEKGVKKNPTIEVINKLSKALNLEPIDFVDFMDSKQIHSLFFSQMITYLQTLENVPHHPANQITMSLEQLVRTIAIRFPIEDLNNEITQEDIQYSKLITIFLLCISKSLIPLGQDFDEYKKFINSICEYVDSSFEQYSTPIYNERRKKRMENVSNPQNKKDTHIEDI